MKRYITTKFGVIIQYLKGHKEQQYIDWDVWTNHLRQRDNLAFISDTYRLSLKNDYNNRLIEGKLYYL